MLILTGARKREVLDAKWEDFDLGRRSWRIPISKSGKARHVPLSDGALNVLASMSRKVEWAFANLTRANRMCLFSTLGTPHKRAQVCRTFGCMI